MFVIYARMVCTYICYIKIHLFCTTPTFDQSNFGYKRFDRNYQDSRRDSRSREKRSGERTRSIVPIEIVIGLSQQFLYRFAAPIVSSEKKKIDVSIANNSEVLLLKRIFIPNIDLKNKFSLSLSFSCTSKWLKKERYKERKRIFFRYYKNENI